MNPLVAFRQKSFLSVIVSEPPIVEPFADFWSRPGAHRVLAFVMLFKLGEALAHTMAVPFYNSLGFDRAQIALATGIPGLCASLAGAVAGGWLVIRIGTGRALILTGFVQMASMSLYFALAVSGGETHILLAKIILESFCRGDGGCCLSNLPLVPVLHRIHCNAICPSCLPLPQSDYGRWAASPAFLPEYLAGNGSMQRLFSPHYRPCC